MKLKFFGGANSVTGACYLIETNNKKFLVDCGMFQSGKYCDERNFKPFPFNPGEIDYLFITHAHIDHIGRIPKLIKEGFRGRIFATRPTKDLTELSLLDSSNLVEEEAKRDGHDPLYVSDDVQDVLNFFDEIDYYQKIDIDDSAYCIFKNAGHILGSSIIEIYSEGKKIVFSGDLGNVPNPLLNPPDIVKDADYIIVESAYGNRIHEDLAQRKEILEDCIEDTVTSGGVLMIPAFAMERTQDILYEIDSLIEQNRIPGVPVFLDSPLAIKSTEIYKKYSDSSYYNKDIVKIFNSNRKLFDFPRLKFTLTTEESKRINDIKPPKIIIAGSGMSQGGRIVHHERRYLPDPKSMLLIIGYQVAGSLGRRLLEGAKEVKILGEVVPVNAKIKAIGGYSAHADQKALFNWVSYSKKTLKRVFVVQGEEGAANHLAVLIRDYLGVQAIAPFYGEEFIL